MPEFNDWFPTARYGTDVLNVKGFGAIGNGIANAMSTLGFTSPENARNGIGGNGIAYPSCTDLNQTADWCAITEAFKHAFQHETSPGSGTWIYNVEDATPSKPVCFPHGRYVTRHPLDWKNIQHAWIFGLGLATIFNEALFGARICIAGNGISYTRIENLGFGIQGTDEDNIAFDLNVLPGALVNTNSDLFINCNFNAPGGIGCNIGAGGTMGSEMTFIRCSADICVDGFAIWNWNALNYVFLGSGATECTNAGIHVITGGNITVMNGSFALNNVSIEIGAGQAAIIATRTEDKFFVKAAGRTNIIGCVQNAEGNDCVFVEAGAPVNLSNPYSDMGRLTGESTIWMDDGTFNVTQSCKVTAVASGTGGVVRLTHNAHANLGYDGTEYWLDGDEVVIQGVTSSAGGTSAVNGAHNIVKIDGTHIELPGTVYSGTYTLAGASSIIQPGPRFHLRNTNGTKTMVKVCATPSKVVHETKTKNFQLLWADSGKTFDNDGATGPVTIRLPSLGQSGWWETRGASYMFIVLTAQTLTIEVDPEWFGASLGQSPRMFRAGGYATAGTNISSNVIGNSVEIYLADCAASPDHTLIGHRWLIRAEAITWTLAGTPA